MPNQNQTRPGGKGLRKNDAEPCFYSTPAMTRENPALPEDMLGRKNVILTRGEENPREVMQRRKRKQRCNGRQK